MTLIWSSEACTWKAGSDSPAFLRAIETKRNGSMRGSRTPSFWLSDLHCTPAARRNRTRSSSHSCQSEARDEPIVRCWRSLNSSSRRLAQRSSTSGAVAPSPNGPTPSGAPSGVSGVVLGVSGHRRSVAPCISSCISVNTSSSSAGGGGAAGTGGGSRSADESERATPSSAPTGVEKAALETAPVGAELGVEKAALETAPVGAIGRSDGGSHDGVRAAAAAAGELRREEQRRGAEACGEGRL